MKTLSVYGYILRGEDFDYPYIECIKSVEPIADEIVISTDPKFADGTIEKIQALKNPKIKLVIDAGHDWKVSWQDGYWKNIAREKCTSDILMQIDFDEIVREEDHQKIRNMVSTWNKNQTIVAVGVINWFNGDNLDLKAAGWKKERFSINTPHIKHGIPINVRIPEEDGYYHAQEGSTDGAAYLDANTEYPMNADTMICDPSDLPKDIFNPQSIYLHHYAWYNIPRKWETKLAWHYMWGRLYGRYKSLEDYKLNPDNEPVYFYGQVKRKPPISYKQAIVEEINKPVHKIITPKNLEHPKLMSEWVKRQIVYEPAKWPFKKELMRNMMPTGINPR